MTSASKAAMFRNFEHHPVSKTRCRKQLDEVKMCMEFYGAGSRETDGQDLSQASSKMLNEGGRCWMFACNLELCLKNNGIVIIK